MQPSGAFQVPLLSITCKQVGLWMRIICHQSLRNRVVLWSWNTGGCLSLASEWLLPTSASSLLHFLFLHHLRASFPLPCSPSFILVLFFVTETFHFFEKQNKNHLMNSQCLCHSKGRNVNINLLHLKIIKLYMLWCHSPSSLPPKPQTHTLPQKELILREPLRATWQNIPWHKTQHLASIRISTCCRGAWVAQLVEPDFGSGHDLTVCEFEFHIGLSAISTEPVSAPPPTTCTLSQK